MLLKRVLDFRVHAPGVAVRAVVDVPVTWADGERVIGYARIVDGLAWLDVAAADVEVLAFAEYSICYVLEREATQAGTRDLIRPIAIQFLRPPA